LSSDSLGGDGGRRKLGKLLYGSDGPMGFFPLASARPRVLFPSLGGFTGVEEALCCAAATASFRLAAGL
jgi:hypothetical protein